MSKLLKVNFEGINYYVPKGALTVNLTTEDVNEANYQDVSDFNCFTMTEKIMNESQLEAEVMDYVATEKLHDVIIKDLEKITTSQLSNKIVSKIESQKSSRESFILANYKELEEEGPLLNIYDTDGNGMSIDFRKNLSTVGDIVG